MIQAWMKNLIRKTIDEDYPVPQRLSERRSHYGKFEDSLAGKEAGIVYMISNGYIVRTQGGFLYAKDAKEVADQIIGEATRNKLGIEPTQLKLDF